MPQSIALAGMLARLAYACDLVPKTKKMHIHFGVSRMGCAAALRLRSSKLPSCTKVQSFDEGGQ